MANMKVNSANAAVKQRIIKVNKIDSGPPGGPPPLGKKAIAGGFEPEPKKNLELIYPKDISPKPETRVLDEAQKLAAIDSTKGVALPISQEKVSHALSSPNLSAEIPKVEVLKAPTPLPYEGCKFLPDNVTVVLTYNPDGTIVYSFHDQPPFAALNASLEKDLCYNNLKTIGECGVEVVKAVGKLMIWYTATDLLVDLYRQLNTPGYVAKHDVGFHWYLASVVGLLTGYAFFINHILVTQSIWVLYDCGLVTKTKQTIVDGYSQLFNSQTREIISNALYRDPLEIYELE